LQSPSSSQSVQPVVLPLAPQQLLPRHTPLLHSLPAAHRSPSGRILKHSEPFL